MTNVGGPITAEYARPDLARPKTVLWYIAVVCGAGPLVIGCGICLLYLLTRSGVLAFLGFLTILGGLLAFVTGLTCLVIYVWDSIRSGSVPRAKLNRQRAIAIGLLLANFPAAVLCVMAASWSSSRYTVAVANSGTSIVDSAIVTVGGRSHDFGPLAPGERSSKTFNLDDGSTLTFHAVRGGRTLAGEDVGHMDEDQFYDFHFDVKDDSVVTETESKHHF